MSDKTSDSSANYILLTRLADEFAARYRAGERPSVQEYVDRHPELARDSEKNAVESAALAAAVISAA